MAGFTPEQVTALTDIIGRSVPTTYLDFMAAFPPELATRTYPRLPDLITEFELYADPKRVLAGNAMVREEDIWTEEGPWPATHLVIGMDIGGDVVALHLDAPGLPVERLHTEIAQFKRVAPDIGAWAKALLER